MEHLTVADLQKAIEGLSGDMLVIVHGTKLGCYLLDTYEFEGEFCMEVSDGPDGR